MPSVPLSLDAHLPLSGLTDNASSRRSSKFRLEKRQKTIGFFGSETVPVSYAEVDPDHYAGSERSHQQTMNGRISPRDNPVQGCSIDTGSGFGEWHHVGDQERYFDTDMLHCTAVFA